MDEKVPALCYNYINNTQGELLWKRRKQKRDLHGYISLLY